jgi:hypothetical protein
MCEIAARPGTEKQVLSAQSYIRADLGDPRSEYNLPAGLDIDGAPLIFPAIFALATRSVIMGDFIMRDSEASGTSNEADSEAAEEVIRMPRVYTIGTSVADLEGDTLTKYLAVAEVLGQQIRNFHAEQAEEFYVFPAVLVASGVDDSILETLPTVVGEFWVKCEVKGGDLRIINMSSGDPHSVGTNNFNFQALTWANERFKVTNDAVGSYGEQQDRKRSPDCVISVFDRFVPNGATCRLGKYSACRWFVLTLNYSYLFSF